MNAKRKVIRNGKHSLLHVPGTLPAPLRSMDEKRITDTLREVLKRGKGLINDIAADKNVSGPTIGVVLRELERRGWVERTKAKGNSICYIPTPEAKRRWNAGELAEGKEFRAEKLVWPRHLRTARKIGIPYYGISILREIGLKGMTSMREIATNPSAHGKVIHNPSGFGPKEKMLQVIKILSEKELISAIRGKQGKNYFVLSERGKKVHSMMWPSEKIAPEPDELNEIRSHAAERERAKKNPQSNKKKRRTTERKSLKFKRDPKGIFARKSVLDVLRLNTRHSIPEISEKTGLPEDVVEFHLRTLLKEGKISESRLNGRVGYRRVKPGGFTKIFGPVKV